MKDLPHHMKKLNKKVIRSARKENLQETLPEVPHWPDSKMEQKKKAKRELKAYAEARAPIKKSPDKRNQEMKKGRVPVFDRQNAEPKHAKSSKKKTPRI